MVLEFIEQQLDTKEVLCELEMRYGGVATEDNQLILSAFKIKGEDYALGYFEGVAVLFITVNWGDPSIKILWL